MATRAEIDPLTGLRGVAILLVVHAHYFMWCAPYTMASVPQPFLYSAHTASFGMTLFFTLSGALMAYHYLDFGWRKTPSASLGRFSFLRLSRLYPVFLLYCILQLKRIGLDYYGPDWLLPNAVNWLSLQSWYPLQFNGVTVDSHGYSLSWSISTEIGMYLMFGLALVIASRFGRAMGPVLAVGAAVYVAVMVWMVNHPDFVIAWLSSLPPVLQPPGPGVLWRWFSYLSPYFRFAQFILGAAAAVLILRGWDVRLRPVLAVLAPLALAALIWLYVRTILGTPPRPEVLDLYQSACFAILIANSRAQNVLNRVLSSRPLLFVGLVSYSLYLFQGYPATWAGASNLLQFSWDLVPQYLFGAALSLTFGLILAYGSYRLVEAPAKQALRSALAAVVRQFKHRRESWAGAMGHVERGAISVRRPPSPPRRSPLRPMLDAAPGEAAENSLLAVPANETAQATKQ